MHFLDHLGIISVVFFSRVDLFASSTERGVLKVWLPPMFHHFGNVQQKNPPFFPGPFPKRSPFKPRFVAPPAELQGYDVFSITQRGMGSAEPALNCANSKLPETCPSTGCQAMDFFGETKSLRTWPWSFIDLPIENGMIFLSHASLPEAIYMDL